MSARTPRTRLEKAALIATMLAYMPIALLIIAICGLALYAILSVWPWLWWVFVGAAIIFFLICAAIPRGPNE